MIIKSCYIENFGTFHQQSFSFQEGLNVIKEKNGWGKSTLAAFLKAMFYGLEYKMRSRELYERTRYLPWQGGSYGGYLIFETGGKEYKILRSFGKKATDDEFSLYDTATNLPSQDFSERIGEELFGIDCDSFERSIFVSLEGKAPALQDSLSAKLGNLIDNTDDINNFESAYQTLDELATSIKAKRGAGGMLSAADSKLASLREELQECDNALTQMQLLQEQIDSCSESIQQLEKDREHWQKEISNIDLQSRKREFNQLWERKKALESQARSLSELFCGNPPDLQSLNAKMEEARSALALEKQLRETPVTEDDRCRLEKLQHFFRTFVPSDSELSSCEESLAKYREACYQLDSQKPSETEIADYKYLAAKYEGRQPSLADLDRYMEQFHQVSDLKESIHTHELELEHLKLERQQALSEQQEKERLRELERLQAQKAREEQEALLAAEAAAREQALSTARRQRRNFLMAGALLFAAIGLLLLFLGLFSRDGGSSSLFSPVYSMIPFAAALVLLFAALRIRIKPQTVAVKNFMKDAPTADEPLEFLDEIPSNDTFVTSENDSSGNTFLTLEDNNDENAFAVGDTIYDTQISQAEAQLEQLIARKDALEQEYLDFLAELLPPEAAFRTDSEQDYNADLETGSDIRHNADFETGSGIRHNADFETGSGIKSAFNVPRCLSDIKVEVSRLLALRKKFQAYQSFCDQTRADMDAYQSCIDTFLSPYRESCPDMGDSALLALIRENRITYRTLQAQLSEYDRTRQEFEEYTASLSSFLEAFAFPTASAEPPFPKEMPCAMTYMEKMELLRDTYRDYTNLQSELDTLKTQLTAFMETHDMDALNQLTPPDKSLEELQTASSLCDRQIREITDRKASYQQSREQYSVIADRRQDLESEQEHIQEQKEELRRKHQLLTKTMSLLQSAKEKLSTGYLSDTMEAFHRYLSLLDESGAAITLSTDLGTSLEKNGKLWKSDYFSSGYKDLMNICIRLALADAMYQEERPFLILDDPFVNLDDNKLAQATSFLHQLAKQYQVFYFVCHESRAV